eukprot:scaffold320_cov367-Pinguiococcus_pyrenoidosus.AAC.4
MLRLQLRLLPRQRILKRVPVRALPLIHLGSDFAELRVELGQPCFQLCDRLHSTVALELGQPHVLVRVALDLDAALLPALHELLKSEELRVVDLALDALRAAEDRAPDVLKGHRGHKAAAGADHSTPRRWGLDRLGLRRGNVELLQRVRARAQRERGNEPDGNKSQAVHAGISKVLRNKEAGNSAEAAKT